jgi:hypothetical protein
MPKRGEKATHRVRYAHANGMTGTHAAYSLSEARYWARTPLSVEGCTVTIEEVTGRGGNVIEAYANLDDLQTVIDDDVHNDAVRTLAAVRAARLGSQAVEDAQAAVDATLKRGPGRPAKEGGRRIHLNLDGARLAAVDAALAQERLTRPKASRTAVIETLIDEALTARQENHR